MIREVTYQQFETDSYIFVAIVPLYRNDRGEPTPTNVAQGWLPEVNAHLQAGDEAWLLRHGRLYKRVTP